MAKAKRPFLAEQQRLVINWNNKHPEGTAVTVTLDGDQGTMESVTRSEAWMMGGHSAVILLEGIAGGYALDRVRVREGGAA